MQWRSPPPRAGPVPPATQTSARPGMRSQPTRARDVMSAKCYHGTTHTRSRQLHHAIGDTTLSPHGETDMIKVCAWPHQTSQDTAALPLLISPVVRCRALQIRGFTPIVRGLPRLFISHTAHPTIAPAFAVSRHPKGRLQSVQWCQQLPRTLDAQACSALSRHSILHAVIQHQGHGR